MSHTADCYHTETVSAKAATEYATVAPTTSASADTDITNRADDVPAVAWYQRACAEASNDKVAASDAKADVNSIRGFAAMRAVITTSVFGHFSFHGFLNLGNSKKLSKTVKNEETSELGNLCPFLWKPAGRVSHH